MMKAQTGKRFHAVTLPFGIAFALRVGGFPHPFIIGIQIERKLQRGSQALGFDFQAMGRSYRAANDLQSFRRGKNLGKILGQIKPFRIAMQDKMVELSDGELVAKQPAEK